MQGHMWDKEKLLGPRRSTLLCSMHTQAARQLTTFCWPPAATHPVFISSPWAMHQRGADMSGVGCWWLLDGLQSSMVAGAQQLLQGQWRNLVPLCTGPLLCVL
jgi:hypothetical protein